MSQTLVFRKTVSLSAPNIFLGNAKLGLVGYTLLYGKNGNKITENMLGRKVIALFRSNTVLWLDCN